MSQFDNLQRQLWSPGPLHPEIADGEVQVWRINLDTDQAAVDQCRHVLSEDELARAEAFRYLTDRNRWTLARGLLRVVIGRYLYLEPKAVELQAPDQGKPSVRGDQNAIDLRFNISHCEGIALFAFSVGREVGVDVERIRTDISTDEVAAHVFSPEEILAMNEAVGRDRFESFFAYWTCKEAYVKAIGHGLSYPMARFTVRWAEDAGGCVSIEDAVQKTSDVTIQRLTVGPDHSAAVALVGEMKRLRCWHGPSAVPIGLWRTPAGRRPAA